MQITCPLGRSSAKSSRYSFFLSTNALFSSRKLLTSFIFFNLNINKAPAFKRITGANTLHFWVDNIHEMALCLPRVNKP